MHSVCVFAPSPLLTITVEKVANREEVHLHAGGQGFWVARMVAELGVPVRLCGVFGGETGEVIERLIEREGVEVLRTRVSGANGVYVHDRRRGERQPIAEIAPYPLSRHEVDELYGAAFVESLEAGVCVITGEASQDVVPTDMFGRLSRDLRDNGVLVMADLSGKALDSALAGGLTLLKVSDEELRVDGRIDSDGRAAVMDAMRALTGAGADNVVVSRGDRPALALIDGALIEVEGPRLVPVDSRGSGDSMTAGLACGLANGADLIGALRLGVAAGGLNAARRGLATGRRSEIEKLARHVRLRSPDRS